MPSFTGLMLSKEEPQKSGLLSERVSTIRATVELVILLKKGLWVYPNAIPPWEYRRQERKSVH